MEPLFKSLIIQLSPQLRKMPPAPLDQNDLQMIFGEVRRQYPYQVFQFTPDERGAIFQNGPEDSVELRPAQIQMVIKLDGPEPLVPKSAEDKAMSILKIACSRLEMESFLQCAIQVVALAAVPGDKPDAKEFVATTLMRDVEHPNLLGHGYFGGGIQFRKLKDDSSGADAIAIEPFLQDNAMIYLNHEKGRAAVAEPIRLDQVSGWIDEAFDFLRGPTMNLLEQGG
jgi:hypothetical protein